MCPPAASQSALPVSTHVEAHQPDGSGHHKPPALSVSASVEACHVSDVSTTSTWAPVSPPASGMSADPMSDLSSFEEDPVMLNDSRLLPVPGQIFHHHCMR